MISRQRLGLPLVFGIAMLLLAALFLKSSPLRANVGYANQTGQACATCHTTGSIPNAGNLSATGQNFVRCGYILNCTVNRAPPPRVAQPQQPNYSGTAGVASNFQLGRVWIVKLREASGRFADLIWTRRGNSNSFDVLWHLDGNRFSDVMNYEGYRNGQISFHSQALKSRFVGTPSRSGNKIDYGRIAGADANPNDSWSATIFGN